MYMQLYVYNLVVFGFFKRFGADKMCEAEF